MPFRCNVAALPRSQVGEESGMFVPELTQARRLVIKVGTSLVTHPGGTLHLGRLEALVRQLSDLRGTGLGVILVTSGAIGAGVGRLGLKNRPTGVSEKQALAAVGQGLLMHTYEKLFAEYGHVVAQVLLTRDDIESQRRRLSARRTMETLLSWDVIPVVNENDTVADEEIRVGDNDTLAARVASLAKADLLIILSDVDGLFTDDPRQEGAEPVDLVTELTPDIWAMAGGAGTTGGTGGMRTKLAAAKICLTDGIPMVIASGHRPGVLAEVTSGNVYGTLFRRPPGAVSDIVS